MLFALRHLLLGIHFIVASCINLLLGLLRPRHRDNSRVFGRVYSLPALRVMGLKTRLEVADLMAMPNPYVLVINHQSNYDLFVLGSIVPPRTVTIGKKSLKWLPFFGQVYWLAGNILIDRGNAQKAKEAMLKSTEVMQNESVSILVFPEGTRNLGRGLLPFKKGAFQMAINAGVPIVPLCCSNYKRDMRLNRWRSGHLRIRALPPIPTAGLTLDDMPELMEQCRQQMAAGIVELDKQTA